MAVDTELTLNPNHEVRYFSDPDPARVLKRASKFIKENEVENVSSLNMTIQWDDELNSLRYDAYLIHGGF